MWKLYGRYNNFKIKGLYTAFVREATNGFLFPGEVHDFWEMMYCIKGSAVVSAGDRVLNLKENQITFFKPMEFHSFRVEEGVRSRFFILSFESEGDLTNYLEDKVFNLFQEHKRKISDIINAFRFDKFLDEDDEDLTVFLEKILSEPYKINEIINMIENFIIAMSGIDAASSQFIKNYETIVYTNALKVIDDYLNNKLTVEQLAKKCSISPTYLKKIFKKYSGLGIHEYILKNKMSIVKQLLSEGESVTEIAEKLGFSSQNYLSTAFKRETGISPTDYKK